MFQKNSIPKSDFGTFVEIQSRFFMVTLSVRQEEEHILLFPCCQNGLSENLAWNQRDFVIFLIWACALKGGLTIMEVKNVQATPLGFVREIGSMIGKSFLYGIMTVQNDHQPATEETSGLDSSWIQNI